MFPFEVEKAGPGPIARLGPLSGVEERALWARDLPGRGQLAVGSGNLALLCEGSGLGWAGLGVAPATLPRGLAQAPWVSLSTSAPPPHLPEACPSFRPLLPPSFSSSSVLPQFLAGGGGDAASEKHISLESRRREAAGDPPGGRPSAGLPAALPPKEGDEFGSRQR